MQNIITLCRPSKIDAFISGQKRKFLRLCIKSLKNRGDYPKFWVIFSDPICREILTNGFYEKELLQGMQYLAKDKKGIAIDVGANIGNHTIYFSRIFSRVISFEPVPSNCWILKANLHLNRIGNVTLVEKGLGAKAESLLLGHDDPENTNNAFSSNPVGDEKNSSQKMLMAEVVRGDDELARLGVDSEVAIIKIDVEGFEPYVLQGLEQTIIKHRPIIFWEAFTHETANPSVEILKAMGYKHFYHMTTNRFGSKLANKLSNSFGKFTYLIPLNECINLDGMNVAMMNAIS
ncbi:MAG: FkbM family methyltransferase [Gallionella sp.]